MPRDLSSPPRIAKRVLYDGSPGWPQNGALWQLAADEQLTFLGTSAAYLITAHKDGTDLGATYDLALNGLGSTGSPLTPELVSWIRHRIARAGQRLHERPLPADLPGQ